MDKLPELKGTTIKELRAGDCFTYPDTKIALMKTSDKKSNNVISLYNGNLSTVHEDTVIIPLPNARVVFPEEANPPAKEEKKEKKEWYDYTLKEIKLNYCNERFGCSNCPLVDACKEHLMVEELMEALDDILDDIIYE